MLANIGVHDEAHRGFRAIHKMNNIRPLSGVIWGEFPGDEMAALLASRDNILQ